MPVLVIDGYVLLWLIEHDEPRIGALLAVYCRGTKSHDESEHPRPVIRFGGYAVGADRVAHPCRVRHKESLVMGSRHSLDQQRHLLVPLIKSASQAVVKRRQAHCAGVHIFDGLLELEKPLLLRPLIRAENGFIFSGKCISEAVLQQRTGPDDDRIRSVIIEHSEELLPDRFTEFPLQEITLHILCQRKISLVCPLSELEIPEMIVDDIRIKNIRPDVVGIMRLDVRKEFRVVHLDDLPGQQHAAGLSSDHTGPDHALSDPEKVPGSHIFLDQNAEVRILRQHDIAHSRTEMLHIRARLHPGLRLSEKALPAVRILVLAQKLLFLQLLIISGQPHALFCRLEGALLRKIDMRHEHRLGLSLPHLDRRHKDAVPHRVYVQKELRRLSDLVDRLIGMLPADHGEIGDRIELKEERTGQMEKIAHHKVRRPGDLELRQTVEHIEGVKAFFFYQIVDLHRKILKEMRQVDGHNFKPLPRCQKGLMRRKADIDQIPSVFYGLFDHRLHEEPEFAEIGHLPDDVVSQTNMVKCFIHLRDPGLYFLKSCHRGCLLFACKIPSPP